MVETLIAGDKSALGRNVTVPRTLSQLGIPIAEGIPPRGM